MADTPRYPDTGDGTGAAPDRGSPPRMPRWVKVSGIIVIFLVLLIVALMFIRGGQHGPGRHSSSAGAGGQAPLSSVTADLTLAGGDPRGRTPKGGSR